MNKLGVIVVAALVAFCAAAPAVPVIADTFVAAGDIEVHRLGRTAFGSGVIIRNQYTDSSGKPTGRELEFLNVTVTNDEKTSYEIDYRLEIYDEEPPVEYRIRGFMRDENLHCSKEDLFNISMPAFFGWVNDATYVGVKDLEEVQVNLWQGQFGGTRLSLGVSVNDSTTPLLYARETPGENIVYTFEVFNKTLNSQEMDALKTIPKECGSEFFKNWKSL